MMPRGANKRREHEYGELVQEFKKEGRYRGRQKEVAARIVNKQRAQAGETKSMRAATRSGGSRSMTTRRLSTRTSGTGSGGTARRSTGTRSGSTTRQSGGP